MPRTRKRANDGVLWEVLGPIVKWPLHSPERFFAVLAAFVLALLLVGQLNGGGSTEESTTSPTATGEAPSGDIPPPAASHSSSAGAQGLATQQAPTPKPAPTKLTAPTTATRVAEGFITTWARSDLPQERWFAAVRPYVSVHMAQGLAYADPRLNTAKARSGPARVDAVSPSVTKPNHVVFIVPTKGAGQMRVTCELEDGSWKVTALQPASQPVIGD